MGTGGDEREKERRGWDGREKEGENAKFHHLLLSNLTTAGLSFSVRVRMRVFT